MYGSDKFHDSDRLAVTLKIGSRIVSIREKRDIVIRELGAYLHEAWNVADTRAIKYLREIESGDGIFSLRRTKRVENVFSGRIEDGNKSSGRKTPLNLHEHRTADYLSALGLNKEQAEKTLEGITEIHPEFKIHDSAVRPYVRVA